MKNKDLSVLEYYQKREFNPVPIPVETKEKWEIQRKKRINLLQNHLKIPTNFLKNKHIIEFGCNSGENALVLADIGAHLTLVEPNDQVIPRLESNFKSLNLYNQIHELSIGSIEDYAPKQSFDLVIAEGFLNTLPNRDKLLETLMNICGDTGGLIINYDDRYGGYIELLKSFILKKLCYLNKIYFRGKESLLLAKSLFKSSFENLNTSRPFKAWWEDQLVNPFASCIWSLDEIIKIAEKENFFCYSNSPGLPDSNTYRWYKDINILDNHNENIMQAWLNSFAYILCGKKELAQYFIPAQKQLIESIFDHTQFIADYISKDNVKEIRIDFPIELSEFLNTLNHPYFKSLCKELKNIYLVLNNGSSKEIIEQYNKSNVLRETWGTMLHYVCLFKK